MKRSAIAFARGARDGVRMMRISAPVKHGVERGGGVICPLNAPEALVLGLPDGQGRLRVAGRTSPLTLLARHLVGTLLTPP